MHKGNSIEDLNWMGIDLLPPVMPPGYGHYMANGPPVMDGNQNYFNGNVYGHDQKPANNSVEWNKRASGMRLWYATEKGRTCAVVKASKKLLEADGKWQDLKNVSALFIEDEDMVIRMIPHQIRTLRHLRILSIRWAKIKSLVPELVQLPITHLCLSNNRLRDANGIEEMSSLVVLNLAFNELVALPYNIGNLRALRELDVSGNKMQKIPESIGALRHMRILTLSANRLTSLPVSICDLEKVKILEISMNAINYLPEHIGKMKGLVELYASDNKIASFPPSIQSCAELRHLHMRKNNISEVPKMLRHLPYLEVFNLRQNCVTDFRPTIASLKKLLLDTNEFTHIPDAIFTCRKLEQLCMDDNLLTEIPAKIQDLTKLRVLYVNYNKIQALPDEMCSLDQLKHLSLQSNKIQFLPTNFYNLHNLTVLNFEDNDLEPELFQSYRTGIPDLLEHVRKLANGELVTFDPKNVQPDKDYTGSRTAILVRNSTPRGSSRGASEVMDTRPNIRGRYAYSALELNNTRASTLDRKENAEKRYSGGVFDKKAIPAGITSANNISRSRPGTAERKPEEHPGHIGHFENISVKRGSSKKKNKDKKNEEMETGFD